MDRQLMEYIHQFVDVKSYKSLAKTRRMYFFNKVFMTISMHEHISGK